MKKLLLVIVVCLDCLYCNAGINNMVVDVKKPVTDIAPTMYGVFFEDINFAADGGLYAEMVKNRSFEYQQNLMGWKVVGDIDLKNDGPFENNPHYLRLNISNHRDRYAILENEGFFGIAVKEGEDYRISLWARCPEGGESNLRVTLANPASMGESHELVNGWIKVEGREWKKYSTILKAPETKTKLVLRIFMRQADGKPIATCDVEHVSMFPLNTWKGRENGMRQDLVQKLADMKPGVFRFPGGCIVEGTDLATRYQWKKTVGPVENRPLNENRWQYTFAHRMYPDYYQSGGLGFFEFFQLCEDMGCEALPVISCGLSCQFQNPDPNEPGVHADVDNLDEYIQDAADLIEFANGDVTTKWGKVRAEMGHPEPFNLHYLAIGNEQWDYEGNPAFTARLQKFLDVLRKLHPDIQYIGSTGPYSDGKDFDVLQTKMIKMKVDLYDEHYYQSEKWFLDAKNRHRYDTYSRKGPKVFAGEYACHETEKKYNHFYASLCEAAFMTGIERNADIVRMATYAPLFAHVEGWQWRPDMIWYDNLQSVGSCSYYVQKLYSVYKGTHLLSLKMNGKDVAGDDDQNDLFASAVWDKKNGCYYIKIANVGTEQQSVSIQLRGLKKGNYKATGLTLQSDDREAENTLDNPEMVVPRESAVSIENGTLNTIIQPRSFNVLVVSYL